MNLVIDMLKIIFVLFFVNRTIQVQKIQILKIEINYELQSLKIDLVRVVFLKIILQNKKIFLVLFQILIKVNLKLEVEI